MLPGRRIVSAAGELSYMSESMAEQVLEPRFPVAGVVRRQGLWGDFALGEAPVTPWAVNVRPEGPYYSRLRGGSRPGLTNTTDSRPSKTDKLVSGGEDEHLQTESNGFLVTESGDLLDLEGGYYVVTEDGDYITAGNHAAVPISDGRTYVDVGFDAPVEFSAACVYRDRACMTSTSELAIHMSRQGDHSDWDYGADAEDEGRATLVQLVGAGEWYSAESGVTCLIPCQDQVLLAATANTLWGFFGDPVAGGRMQNISRDVGVVSQKAWCKAEGGVCFLSARGLYMIGQDGSGLKSLSESRVPEELADVGTAVLGYRAEDYGVYIFTDGDYHWFYDLAGGGFWPFTLDSDHEPTAVYKSGADLVLVCSDGQARTVSGSTDNGTAIESHLLLGPFRTAPGAGTGLLTRIEGALAEDSGSVTWRIVSADTAELAASNAKTAVGLYLAGSTTSAEAYAKTSGTYGSGRTLRSHPRIRGQWFVVWLQSTARWSFEWLTLGVAVAGRYR